MAAQRKAPIKDIIINAGIEARAHFTIKITIDQKGILIFVTTN